MGKAEEMLREADGQDEEKSIFAQMTQRAVDTYIRTLCLVLLATYLTGYAFKILKPVLLPFFLALFFSVPFVPVVDFLSQLRTTACTRRCIGLLKPSQDRFVAKASCGSSDDRGFGLCGCYRSFCRGLFASLTTGYLPYGVALVLAILGIFAVLGLIGYIVYLSVSAFYENESQVCVGRFHEIADGLADIVVRTFGYNSTVFGPHGNETLTGAHLVQEATVRLDPARLVEEALAELMDIFHASAEIMLLLVYILIARRPTPDHLPSGKPLHTTAGGSRQPPLAQRISSAMQRYLLSKLIVACINGVLCGLLLFAFGVPLWPVFGLLTVPLDFIPTIGALVTGLLPLPFILCRLPLTEALVVFVCLNLLQFSVGEFIEPRVVGDSMEISTVVVILGLLFFGWAWSIPGMVLAVPIISIIKIVSSEVNHPLGDAVVSAIAGFPEESAAAAWPAKKGDGDDAAAPAPGVLAPAGAALRDAEKTPPQGV